MNDVNFANYADDNTIYGYVKNIDSIIMLQQESTKCLSTDEQFQILIGDSSSKRSSCEKLLAVNTD